MPWDAIEDVTTDARLRIISFLISHEDEFFYEKELAERVNLTPSGVSRTIKPLLDLGLIRKMEKGRMNLYVAESKNIQHTKELITTLEKAVKILAELGDRPKSVKTRNTTKITDRK